MPDGPAANHGAREPSLVRLEDRRMQAVSLILFAFLGFTGIDTCAKWLVTHGLPTPEVIFVRYVGHLVIVVSLAIVTGENVLRTANPSPVVLRGLFLLMSTALNFTALSYLPLTVTSAVAFTSPLWICLLSIPLLGERVGPRRWTAILIGFVGILVVTRPWGGAIHWSVLLAVGATVSVAFYAIITRRLAGRDSTATQQFYAAAIAAGGTAPLAFAKWVWPSDSAGWVAFCLIGVFGWVGHQLLTTAHRYAPASTLAPFVYIQILYMSASSWIIFGQPPDRWVIAGSAIVAGSGLYIWLRERSIATSTSRG